jgi:predicted HicB family RNase H-like nuclease
MRETKQRKNISDKYATVLNVRIPISLSNHIHKVSLERGINVSKVVREKLEESAKHY